MCPSPITGEWSQSLTKQAEMHAEEDSSYGDEDVPALPREFRRLFYSGHLLFTKKSLNPFELSTHYRALILDCKDALINTTDQYDSLPGIISSLEQAHSVWHLIEVVWLTPSSENDRHISDYLAQWYSSNVFNPDSQDATEQSKRMIASLYKKDSTPQQDKQLWDLVTKVLITGNIVEARQLLVARMEAETGFDSEWTDSTAAAQLGQLPEKEVGQSSSAYAHVEAILGRAPEHRISTRNDGSWEEWQKNCAVWAESDELQSSPQAIKVLKLLAGDTQDIAISCETWQEMFVACSFYLQDSIGLGGNITGGPGRLADICAAASKVYEPPKDIAGGALIEVAMGNLKDAIVRIEASLPSSWFAAHLTDLLVYAEIITDELGSEVDDDGMGDAPVGIREFYIKEYARSLERYRGCWRLVVDYYLSCPTQGKSMLVDLLYRVPLEGSGDLTTEKVLLICEKENLRKMTKRICTKLAAECLERDNLGGATMWYARAGSPRDVRAVADTALKAAEAYGAKSQGSKKLDSVVNSVAGFGSADMQDALHYLRIYRDMQTALSDLMAGPSKAEQIMTLGSLFRDTARVLVTGGGLPRRYWSIICYDVARVLDNHEDVASLFSADVIEDLLQAVELSTGPHRIYNFLDGVRARIALERVDSTPTRMKRAFSDSTLASVEEAENALEQCRSVFVKAMALRINID